MMYLYYSALNLLAVLTICYAQPDPVILKKNFIYGTYYYDTRISVTVSNNTEQILDFNEINIANQVYPTRVHVSTNDSIPLDHPVFITATQQKGISSWELPMVVKTGDTSILFNDMSRTLCPHDAGPDLRTVNSPTIHIMTQNPENTTVDIKLRRVDDFYVEVNKEIPLNATPSTPKYYYFSFDQNPWNVTHNGLEGLPVFNYTIPKSVILVIDSDDDLCATVSIQNNSCPVFDDEKEIMYQGYHLTMSSKGGITLSQPMFPLGFYVVFVVKESDAECTGESETVNAQSYIDRHRLKSFRFSIIATVSYREYAIGAIVIFVLVILIIAFVVLAAIPFRNMQEGAIVIFVLVILIIAFVVLAAIPFRNMQEEELLIVNEPVPSTSQIEAAAPSGDQTDPILEDDKDTDDSEEEYALTVARLTQAPPETLARRSERYIWGALTIAVVYSLPVVQLLFTYQQMVFQTGNQDLCYYNFLCAHPLGFLSDFNHVYSNIAYIMFGVAFMLQVRARQRQAANRRQDKGIPQHYGLLYAMGLALCMEGFLSACYHLCPNKMNFQFDSSFMYVIAVLVMLKLYQNRHSDLVPSAHATFMLIAVIIAIGMLGILFPSEYFSIIFTLLHLTTCVVLTLKIYYAGSCTMKVAVMRLIITVCACSVAVDSRGRSLVPTHKARALLLALANIANWAFALYAANSHNKDLARQLLAILMGNTILYLWFYIGMKLSHGERVKPHAWVYFVLAHAAWASAGYLFIHGNTRWSETPAMSRRRNAECSALSLFDSHDLWHVTSAAACFLSYNLLLAVDDDVSTPRTHIHTF